MDVISFACSTFILGNKVFIVAKTARRSYEIANSLTQESTQTERASAVFNRTTACIQAMDIIADFAAPPPVQVGIKAALAISDIGRMTTEISSKETVTLSDKIGCVSSVLFRASDITQSAINAKYLNEGAKTALKTFQIASGVVGISRDVIQREERRSALLARNARSTSHTQRIPRTESIFRSKIQRWENTVNSFLHQDNRLSINNTYTIPKLWDLDVVLNRYRCPLDNDLIRDVWVVEGTQTTDHPIYTKNPSFYFPYKILPKHVNKEGISYITSQSAPKEWPKKLSWTGSLLKSPSAQKTIDQRLSLLVKLWKIKSPYENVLSEMECFTTIEDFPFIPFSFALWPDPIFCPIRALPIRFICVVKGTENRENPVYYEKRAISAWFSDARRSSPQRFLSTHLPSKPPHWPFAINCVPENIIECPSIQEKINKKLNLLLRLGKTKDPYDQEVFEIMQAHSIQDFLWIPKMFHNEPALQAHCCPILQAPIRFLCKVSLNHLSQDAVYYEKRAILQWLANETQSPPRWPENIPYSQITPVSHDQQAFIFDCFEEQKKIDRILADLLSSTQSELLEL